MTTVQAILVDLLIEMEFRFILGSQEIRPYLDQLIKGVEVLFMIDIEFIKQNTIICKV